MTIIVALAALGALLFGGGIMFHKMESTPTNQCTCEVAVGKGAEAVDKTEDKMTTPVPHQKP